MQAPIRGAGVGGKVAGSASPRVRKGGGLMAFSGRHEVHHRVPRCLIKAWDRGHGPGLEPEDLQAWIDWVRRITEC